MNEELITLLKQIKAQWGQETVAAILRTMDTKRSRLTFTGGLRSSVKYKQASDIDGDISFSMAPYGQFVDKGVKGVNSNYAANKDTTFSFKSLNSRFGIAFHVKKWANAKGLNEYAVATNLAKKGIEARKFFDTVIESRVGILGEYITRGIADFFEAEANRLNNTQQ
jgi:hypothetical protein